MSNEQQRVWLTLSRGISPDLSEPVIQREVNRELVEDAPTLVVALKAALRRHLASAHGRIPLDGEGDS